MAKRVETGVTAAEKDELWVLYKSGATCATIGRTLGNHVSTICSIVRASGGIAPRRRVRASRSLSQVERETISRGLTAGTTRRSIARTLKHAPSTIRREMTRHGGPERYRAVEADFHAWHRAKRPKVGKLVRVPLLRAVVDAKLRANWSPAQISGWLVNEHSEARDRHVSHETIYRSLFVQARAV